MDLPSPQKISSSDLRLFRLRAQHLEPRASPYSLVDAVRDVCGVNAQLPSAMELSLRARVANLTAESLEQARTVERSLVRTWCMRSTLHLLAASDLDWLLTTLDPAHVRAAWRWLERRAGLDRAAGTTVLEAAHAILQIHGPLPRRELMRLVSARVGFDAQPAAAGTVLLGGLLGQVCFGPDCGAYPTYTAVETWLGRSVDVTRTPDLAGLVRRYLRGYGPARPQDLAAWWGTGLAQVRRAWQRLEGELTGLDVEGELLWQPSGIFDGPDLHPEQLCVRLIPAFDSYLLGYQNREFAVPRQYQGQVFHGGEIAPVVLADGLAVGTWRYEQRGGKFWIKAAPFEEFTSQVRDGIEAEAADIGRFYNLSPVLSFPKRED